MYLHVPAYFRVKTARFLAYLQFAVARFGPAKSAAFGHAI